jgi:hopanoid biosynthesis associated protein HpnK
MGFNHPVLIITGDDFGLSQSVNRAIIRAHREGVLTHASLMVNEHAAAEAIELARASPTLSTGLHVSLVLGRAALPRQAIPHLIDGSGEFRSSPFISGLNYYFSMEARRELRSEIRAQFERYSLSGLRLSHVDGHNHLHMHPVVFDELLRLATSYGVDRLRIVGNEWATHRRTGAGMNPASWAMGKTFEMLARSCIRRFHREGRKLRPVRVYGLFGTGSLDEEYLTRLIEEIDFEDSEIYLHPLDKDAPEEERAANPNGSKELDALLSPRVRGTIEKRGFRLDNTRIA